METGGQVRLPWSVTETINYNFANLVLNSTASSLEIICLRGNLYTKDSNFNDLDLFILHKEYRILVALLQIFQISQFRIQTKNRCFIIKQLIANSVADVKSSSTKDMRQFNVMCSKIRIKAFSWKINIGPAANRHNSSLIDARTAAGTSCFVFLLLASFRKS